MGWFEDLRPASFRGVPFFVAGAPHEGGRRLAVHEFPGREDVVTHDLGRKAARFTLQAFVVGDDYHHQRDRLEAALAAPGPGRLVHPYRGQMRVSVAGGYRTHESSDRGGMATITFEVVLEGDQRQAARLDTPEALREAADAVNAAAELTLADELVTEDMPSSLLDTAVESVRSAATVIAQAHGKVTAALGEIDDAAEAISELGNDAASLIRTPHELASTAVDLIGSTLGAGAKVLSAIESVPGAAETLRDALLRRRTVAVTLSAGDDMHQIGSNAEPIPAATPKREQANRNREVLDQTFREIAVAETCRTVADLEFGARQDAIEARDTLHDRIEDLEETASDEAFHALGQLRVALADHLESVAATLPRVRTVVLGEEMPALLLAHRLYGDARRESEILARNRIAHPLFLPAGVPLEVLDA